MTERRIRQSQLSKFRRCRRSWEMEYVRGLELARNPDQTKGARDIGTVVHTAVEAYYTGRSWKDEMKAAIEAKVTAGTWSPEWMEVYELARIMVEGWEEWLATTAADANEEVLLCEQNLELHLGTFHGDDVILTGKPDLVVRNTLNDLVIVDDTKTVGKFQNALIHSGQGLTYGLMLKMGYDLEPDLFRTTQLRKVKRTARAKPPFYQRSEAFINTQMLRHHYIRTQAQVDTMVELMQFFERQGTSDRYEYDKLFYPNPTGTCDWDCDFLAVCAAMDDGSNYEHILNLSYRPKPDDYADEETDAADPA